ncbi:MAG: hypothetical protein CME98_11220 [Hyphomonas sp.]|nr:hypothetical protein [Hyphomonas sp.]
MVSPADISIIKLALPLADMLMVASALASNITLKVDVAFIEIATLSDTVFIRPAALLSVIDIVTLLPTGWINPLALVEVIAIDTAEEALNILFDVAEVVSAIDTALLAL